MYLTNLPGAFLTFLIAILGLVFGSFISSITWRIPKAKTIFFDRSICPKCKKRISFFDNIPLISYLILGAKCRNCKKRISIRYPLIELSSMIGFLSLFFVFKGYPLLLLLTVYVLFLVTLTIFIIDLERQIIPDNLVFILFLLFILKSYFLSAQAGLNPNSENIIWDNIFFGFTASLFLLFLHLVTKGKGMGLGDVKLALPLGFLLGGLPAYYFMFYSFLTGAIVGIILILAKKASFGQRIAFGPFMIIGFWISFVSVYL